MPKYKYDYLGSKVVSSAFLFGKGSNTTLQICKGDHGYPTILCSNYYFISFVAAVVVHHNSLLNFSRSSSEEEQLFGFTCFTFPPTLSDIVTSGNIIISISSVFRIKCISIKIEGASDQVVTLAYAIFPGLPPINNTFKHFWVSSLSFLLF